jgi:hypothetical protein
MERGAVCLAGPRMAQTGPTPFNYWRIYIMRIFLILLTLSLTACGENYSNGEWVGVVTKFSNKGLVFKSWEGVINRGGVAYDEKGSVVANAEGFNVSDPAVVEKIKHALNTGTQVKLTYRQWALAPFSINNSHVVIAVEPI